MEAIHECLDAFENADLDDISDEPALTRKLIKTARAGLRALESDRRALLASRAELEDARRVADRGAQIAVTLLKRLCDNPYPDINSEWAILQHACEDLLRINSRAAARAALRGETK